MAMEFGDDLYDASGRPTGGDGGEGATLPPTDEAEAASEAVQRREERFRQGLQWLLRGVANVPTPAEAQRSASSL